MVSYRKAQEFYAAQDKTIHGQKMTYIPKLISPRFTLHLPSMHPKISMKEPTRYGTGLNNYQYVYPKYTSK